MYIPFSSLSGAAGLFGSAKFHVASCEDVKIKCRAIEVSTFVVSSDLITASVSVVPARFIAFGRMKRTVSYAAAAISEGGSPHLCMNATRAGNDLFVHGYPATTGSPLLIHTRTFPPYSSKNY